MNRKRARTFKIASPSVSKLLPFDRWLQTTIRGAIVVGAEACNGANAEEWKQRWSLAGMIEEDLEDADGYDEDDDDVL